MINIKNNWKRSFYTIWAGQAISLITSAILQMALIWYLTNKTGSAMVLSIASLVGFLPQAILGPFIGVLIDRYNRKYIMIGADLLITAAGLFLAIVSIYMELPVWIIMLVLFLRSVGTAFHSPSLNAVTPLIVPEDQLVKCAGYSQSIQSISYILSPVIAAFLYAVWDMNQIIALDVLGAVIACIAVAVVNIPKIDSNAGKVKQDFMIEMKDGFATLHHNKGLFALLWIGALYMLIYMPINALFPLISIGYFNGTTAFASVVESSFAVGMLLGGLLLGTWGGFKKRYLSIGTSILLMGVSLIISGILPVNQSYLFVICSLFMGLSSPFYSGVQAALFQEKIQPEYLGRVFALMGSLMSLAMPLGLILSGLFTDQVGINHWFLFSGILILALSILCIMLPSIRALDKK